MVYSYERFRKAYVEKGRGSKLSEFYLADGGSKLLRNVGTNINLHGVMSRKNRIFIELCANVRSKKKTKKRHTT
jgi:hypothetical protein